MFPCFPRFLQCRAGRAWTFPVQFVAVNACCFPATRVPDHRPAANGLSNLEFRADGDAFELGDWLPGFQRSKMRVLLWSFCPEVATPCPCKPERYVLLDVLGRGLVDMNWWDICHDGLMKRERLGREPKRGNS